jgi:type IV fimbrial biogenesis protein FimT
MARKRNLYRQGHTLVELLITMTILGIVTSLAIPALGNMRAKNTMAGSINLFLTQLQYARSTAVTREKNITLCPTTNNLQCRNDHQSWGDGVLIFEDSNKNQTRDAQEPVISIQEGFDTAITIASSSAHRNRITFLPLGRAWFSNTTVRFCHQQQPELNRAIIISNNGRVRVQDTLANSAPIICP